MSSRRPRTSAGAASSGEPRGVRTIDLKIPSDVREIERVVEAVQRECERMHFGARQLMLNVPVALTEALSNAILRGNADDPRKHVTVHARIDGVALVVEVRDEGAGFDLDECLIDPTTPDRLEMEQGRGLFLMQKLMDSVERFAARPRGNIVRLTLRRAS
ncbi:MAG TPA: ATP-binding protein [Gemmatimonadaceae bacterium]|nr:ATP-binding protein [Gemmatimonadaceae bacterium]